MPTLRFVAVEGDDPSAEAGFIEITDSGTIRCSPATAWMLDDVRDGGLPAPLSVGLPGSPSTRPFRGFNRIGEEADGTVLFAPDPPTGWDGRMWLDKLQDHFRTPYLRPLGVTD